MISCGKALVGAQGWNPACGEALTCYSTNKTTGARQQDTAFATLTETNGTFGNPQVWCPADAQPVVTLAAIREEAERLLPTSASARPGPPPPSSTPRSFWAATARQRGLPTVTIVGQQVALRIDLEDVHWDFGDEHTDTVTDPGRPYDKTGDPCRTAQCPDYYGHTYVSTGRMTITLAATWHAQFSIAGGAWTDLDQPITGPTDQHDITVGQARGILVQTPEH